MTRAVSASQDLDVTLRSIHTDPLPVASQPLGILHLHHGRQTVLPRSGSTDDSILA
jgi:hypothetical protein